MGSIAVRVSLRITVGSSPSSGVAPGWTIHLCGKPAVRATANGCPMAGMPGLRREPPELRWNAEKTNTVRTRNTKLRQVAAVGP